MINRLIKKILAGQGYRLELIYPKLKQADFKRLSQAYKNYQPIKLHLGCGSRILKGWINIDLLYQPWQDYDKSQEKIDYPINLRGEQKDFYALNIMISGLPLPDNCVDVVFHEDFIEHLDQRDQVILLAETLRVLKPGGVHRVNTPNLLKAMSEHSDFRQGKNGVYAAEWNNHIHLNILTQDSLSELARMVGYSQIVFNNKNQSISPLMPPEYRPSGERPVDGNIFADLIK